MKISRVIGLILFLAVSWLFWRKIAETPGRGFFDRLKKLWLSIAFGEWLIFAGLVALAWWLWSKPAVRAAALSRLSL